MSELRIGITGHRGLSPETTTLITARLSEALEELDGNLVGVSLLADGPDSIFADQVLAHGGKLHVVVPAARYRDDLPAEHHQTYDRLIARASHVKRLDYTDSTEVAHMAGSQAMLDSIDQLLAVWDGRPARGYGGTADVVHSARRRGIPVTILWPEGATRD